MPRIIMDTDTGEQLGNLDEGDRILRKASIDHLKGKDEQVPFPKDEPFTKLFHKIMPLMIECGLSAAEMYVLLYLASNLKYDSNIAQYSNGHIITRTNVQNALNISDRTVKRAITMLIKEKFIVEARANVNRGSSLEYVFIVNPFIFGRGSGVDKDTVELFRKSKWARW